jgi:hemerythrin-like domain-containing protein
MGEVPVDVQDGSRPKPHGPAGESRREEIGSSGGSGSPAATALEELHREHEIAARLLARLAELGEQIRSGDRVDSKSVRYGVGLLDAYVHRVHASQMEDRELGSEARGVGPGVDLDSLELMRAHHEEIRRRAHELLELTGLWVAGDDSQRTAIGEGLIDLARWDRDSVSYEEGYTLAYLESILPRATDRSVADRFAEHAGTRAALEANIERFLSKSPAD